MGQTINDYVFQQELSNTDGSALDANLAKKNGLVIVEATNESSNALPPSIRIEGVDNAANMDQNSVPYQAQTRQVLSTGRVSVSHLSYWRVMYTRTYSYYKNVLSQPIITTVMVLVPSEDGTMRVAAFGDNIINLNVRVYDKDVTSGLGFTLQRLGYAPSPQLAEIDGNIHRLTVKKDDVIMAIGTDGSTNAALADITWAGPAFQTLTDNLVTSNGFSVKTNLWRVKANGEVSLTFANCNDGRMVKKYLTNVKESTDVAPSIVEPKAYFEIQPRQDQNGKPIYPDWFEALKFTLRKNDTGIGLRGRWIYENPETFFDDAGRLLGFETRMVEHWAVPAANVSSIGSDAVIFDDRATQEAKRLLLDANIL